MSAGKFKGAHQHASLGKRINQVFALLWVVMGVLVFMQARNLEYMAEYGPGPGFVPIWLGGVIILLGLVSLAQVTFSPQDVHDALVLPSKHAGSQMFLVMFGFFCFAFFCEQVGFLLCIGLLFLFLLVFVERKGWKFSLAVSAISILAFWAVFELWLTLRLPTGFLGFLQ
jgi:putative tricarboxylic transport membrane protein